MRSNLRKVATLFQISTLFGAAFIHTYKTDDDFLPSATTDIQLDDLRTNNNQVTNEEINYQDTEIVDSEVTSNEASVLNDKSATFATRKQYSWKWHPRSKTMESGEDYGKSGERSKLQIQMSSMQKGRTQSQRVSIKR
ncbi:hypothetical protein Trydic_g1766 [Trypoxylus dichotomus]